MLHGLKSRSLRIAHWDMAAVAAESEVPVAAGENVYFKWGFQDIVDRRAAAYLQPDIGRCGGVTEWIKIAQMAEDHDLGSPAIFFTSSASALSPLSRAVIRSSL